MAKRTDLKGPEKQLYDEAYEEGFQAGLAEDDGQWSDGYDESYQDGVDATSDEE